jgi:serine/threonine-protein kinase
MASAHRESLLVVDDDKIILDLLGRTFRASYEVHSASSGEEALKILGEQHVDLLITDQKMPGLTGLDVMRPVRPGIF